MTNAPRSGVAPRAELLSGCYGKYLACHDDKVRVRVLSGESMDDDIFGETPSSTGNWLITAALVVLAWEASVSVVYAVSDRDRDVAWRVAKSTQGYTGMGLDFYSDGDGWLVVIVEPLALA